MIIWIYARHLARTETVSAAIAPFLLRLVRFIDRFSDDLDQRHVVHRAVGGAAVDGDGRVRQRKVAIDGGQGTVELLDEAGPLLALELHLDVRVDLPERGHAEASRILSRLILAQFTAGVTAREAG